MLENSGNIVVIYLHKYTQKAYVIIINIITLCIYNTSVIWICQ